MEKIDDKGRKGTEKRDLRISLEYLWKFFDKMKQNTTSGM